MKDGRHTIITNSAFYRSRDYFFSTTMNVTQDDLEGGRGDGEEEGVVVVVGNAA